MSGKQRALGFLKTLFLATALLTVPIPTLGQTISWTRQFGSSESDGAFAVATDASSLYVGGFTGASALVRKYDMSGIELWTRQFEGNGVLAITTDTLSVYVGGHTFTTLPGQIASGGADAFVRKYDPSGNELWTRQFGSPSNDSVTDLAVDASGIYVAGFTFGLLPGQTNAGSVFLRKYDTNGNELWTRQFEGSNSDQAEAITVDGSGAYIAGFTYSILGQTGAGRVDAFVRKVDPSGDDLWIRQFGTPAIDVAFGISGDATGIYVAVATQNTNDEPAISFVRKYDAYGSELWSTEIATAETIVKDISASTSGIYIAGMVSDNPFVWKYTPGGTEVWAQQIGNFLDHVEAISAHESTIAIGGYTWGALPGHTTAGLSDAFLMGVQDTTTVEAPGLPQNIPNPGELTLTLDFPTAGAILSMELFFQFTHECERDLAIDLVAPDGHTVRVMDRGLMRCSGVPETFTSLTTEPGQPEFFGGRQANGTWQFIVRDDTSGNTGTLDEWRLTIAVDTSMPPPPQLPDLTITSVKPVQAVFDPDVSGDGIADLVLGKDTAFELLIQVDNVSLLPTNPIPVQVQFEDKVYQSDVSKSMFFPVGSKFEATLMVNPMVPVRPMTVGTARISATVDPPPGLVAESNENNNESSSTIVEVKQVKGLQVVYVPFLGADTATESAQKGHEFLTATFPLVNQSAILTGSVSPAPGEAGCISVSCPPTFFEIATLKVNVTSTWDDFITLATVGFLNSADRTVGIVPATYLRDHGLCGYIGLTLSKSSATSLVADQYWTTTAHEIGHTFGLPLVGDEEYSSCPPISNGNPASEGFWPAKGHSIRGGSSLCMMGTSAPATLVFDPRLTRWIERVDYEHLFRGLLTLPEDPSVLLITGVLSTDGKLTLGPSMYKSMALVDEAEGAGLDVRILDLEGTILHESSVPILFEVFLEGFGKLETDSVAFSKRVYLPPRSMKVELARNGSIIATLNPLAKSLRDALTLVPDRAFAPFEQRRVALHNLLGAFENAMEAGNIWGARNILLIFNSLAFTWIGDSYTLEGANHITKQQLLEMTVAVIAHLETF